MKIEIGISEPQRKEIAHGLSRLLADSYSLYLKTHNFHWNVTGPYFNTLHTVFETQYTELALAIDLIAERIRALGEFAPASYSAFSKLSSVKDEAGHPEATKMVHQLLEDHETVARTARGLIPLVDKAGDEVSADLLTQRMQLHEKTAWMLRSFLEA